MKLHANAALSLNQRRRMVRRVVDQRWSLTKAAEAAGRPGEGSRRSVAVGREASGLTHAGPATLAAVCYGSA